jgi:dephospho-CoA kinase
MERKDVVFTMPRIIGLTGNIASGKTSVGRILLDLGAERYIDADALVHRLYGRGQPITQQIVEVFGASMLATDGSVDRRVLGAIVFRDPDALQQLERIVHPAVHLAMQAELSEVSATGIAILDAVKLLEGGSAAFCQSKWLVICPIEGQLARLMARNHMSEEEARARLQAQPDPIAKQALVDEVIDNGGTLSETRQQIIAAFERFTQKFPIAPGNISK